MELCLTRTAICLWLTAARDIPGSTGTIYTFKPSAKNPPIATIFASGVPGADGIAFDKKGNLWTSDGPTGRGRVWKILDGW